MTTKLKNYLTLALAAGLLYGFLLWGILRPDAALSTAERRPLTQRPVFTVQTALDACGKDIPAATVILDPQGQETQH